MECITSSLENKGSFFHFLLYLTDKKHNKLHMLMYLDVNWNNIAVFSSLSYLNSL